jgi:high affinity Mn2+ porin
MSKMPESRERSRGHAGGFERTVFALALTLCGVVGPALPVLAADSSPKLQAQVQQLLDRMQKMEQHNAELARRVQELTAQTAEAQQVPAVLPSTMQDAERLARVERQSVTLQQQLDDLPTPAPERERERDSLPPAFTASLLAVGQNVNAGGAASGVQESRVNYRMDLTAELDAGSLGDAKGKVFAQFRLGQGTGLNAVPSYTSTRNTTAFETAAGPNDSFGILAQAYYQLEWPLGSTGFNESSPDRLVLNIGKMDVFGLFDQNKVAADEGAQFMNNAFVHNPLLDSGGDIAADAYGFAPGVRLGYFSRSDSKWAWGASVGVFGAGSDSAVPANNNGANLSGDLKQPLVIAQLEVSPQQINGEPRGNYRLYAWTNDATTDLSGRRQSHSGVGISVDQRVGRDWNVFGRMGYRTSGDAQFDTAVTAGFEYSGRSWGRPKDALGFAVGSLSTSKAWRDATAGGTLTGYEASGDETIAELYYRIKLNERLNVSPDLQYITRPGGKGNAPTVWAVGLRAYLGF